MLSRIFFESCPARQSFRDRTLKLNPAIGNEYLLLIVSTVYRALSKAKDLMMCLNNGGDYI